jgi:predicted anti-sigma-YlaC factor YlaD
MTVFGKALLFWGVFVLSLLYVLASVSIVAGAYEKDGVAVAIIAATVLSATPAVVFGAILLEIAYRRGP